jgi:hypothetical protein
VNAPFCFDVDDTRHFEIVCVFTKQEQPLSSFDWCFLLALCEMLVFLFHPSLHGQDCYVIYFVMRRFVVIYL